MTLLEELEQNVEVVAKGLEKCVEAIRQQWVIGKDGCISGLQKNAGMNVYKASCLYLTVSSPPTRQFDRILKWLNLNMPRVKVDIEKQYYNLVDGFSRITQISDVSKLFDELSDLEGKLKNLAEDLCDCVKKAREDQAKSSDLDELKPAETERKTTSAKLRKIWTWVKRHPHSYGLIGGVIFLILFFVLGLLKAQWRNWCWGTAGIALLVLILSLLGGRSR